MPRKISGRPLQANRPPVSRKRKAQRGNALNALELAEKQNLDPVRVRSSRLGEVEDDSDDDHRGEAGNEGSNKKRKIGDTRFDDEDVGQGNEDGDVASGSDDEGGRWHEGVDGSEEDSDIDSDEAFGDSDEENFAAFTFRGSESMKPQNKRKQTSQRSSQGHASKSDENDGWEDADTFNNADDGSSSEELEHDDGDEEDEDSLGEDAVDLATALEMNLEEERKEAERSSKQRNQGRGSLLSRGSDESAADSDADSSDEESQLAVSDDEIDGDHAGLRSFVEGLDRPMLPSKSSRKSEARALGATPSSFGIGTSKVSVADLLQSVQDPALRKSLKALQENEGPTGEDNKSGIPGKLLVPLAKRQQDKLDRGAAYEKTKETFSRWVETVKANRRAEHISFPLVDHGSEGAKNTKQLRDTAQSVPRSGLESAIQDILQESGMGAGQKGGLEEQEAAYEELEEKKIPLEDVRERRAQLRLARELMFREEIRAKRIKKIKSKAYRRVHRKEKEKIEAQQRGQLAAAGLLNSDDDREQNDRRRAEERMGARHKESKWAKSIKQTGRAAWDDDARVGVSDLARRDEELRRRVEGKDIDHSDLSDSGSESDADTDTEQQRLDTKLAALQAQDNRASKLGSMAFMLRAEASQKARNDAEIRQIKLALGQDDSDESNLDDSHVAGRQTFGVSQKKAVAAASVARKTNEFEAPLSEDEQPSSDDEPKKSDQIATSSSSQPALSGTKPAPAEIGSQKVSRIGKKSSRAPPSVQGPHPDRPHKQPISSQLDDFTSASESEEEIGTTIVGPAGVNDEKAALAASIFAGGDDVVQEFKRDKKKVVEEEDDQVIDNTLPGWGNWTGAGVSKREQRKGKGRFLTTVKGVAAEKRQDAKLDRVIINEKQVKKNARYLATELPHPFESRQQYERSLRLPVGPEWSTVKHYQDAIKPRVLVRQGAIIKPMSRPLV